MGEKADIWYPKYVGDYHGDTMHLSCLEHGAYNLLMDAYWMNGGPIQNDNKYLANVTKLSLSDWSAIRSVIEKFFIVRKSNPELWIHKRIEIELEKARNNKKAKSLGATKTNEKRWSKKSLSESQSVSLSESQSVSQNGRSSPSPSPSVLAGESTAQLPKKPEPHFPEVNYPSLSEVIESARMTGLPDWKAADWFNEMQGCGWIDFNHRPIRDWRAVMARVKAKWESDGRPAGPKSFRGPAPVKSKTLDFAP